MNIRLSRVTWQPCWRIIPSIFPPINLFERIADPADWEALIEVESLTNDRIRNEVGELMLVPVDERVSGPGASVIMAAFTHPNKSGSRFTDGTYGVYYAAKVIETAVAETRYHREIFMRATNEAKIKLDMRVYCADLDAELHDLRGCKAEYPAIYHPDDYGAAQQLARTLRAAGSYGIAYESVRRPGGECVGIFRPKALNNARQERHLCYVWDGYSIVNVHEKREMQ